MSYKRQFQTQEAMMEKVQCVSSTLVGENICLYNTTIPVNFCNTLQ